MSCHKDDGSAFHTCGPAMLKLLRSWCIFNAPHMSCHMLIELNDDHCWQQGWCHQPGSWVHGPTMTRASGMPLYSRPVAWLAAGCTRPSYCAKPIVTDTWLSSHFLQTLGTVRRTIILACHLFKPLFISLAWKDKSLFHMSLRPRGHSFDLPRYQYNLTRKSFIYRNL